MERVSTSSQTLQEEGTIHEFFNLVATETLALFDHVGFKFLTEYDVRPSRRAESNTESQVSGLFRGFLHCYYKKIYGSRPVTYELRNDLVWFSRGFDRPPLCDAVERFLTDLGFVVEDDFTRLVEQPIWVLSDRA